MAGHEKWPSREVWLDDPYTERRARSDGERSKKSINRKEKRKAIYARDGWACLKCGNVLKLTLDHVLPASWGGFSSKGNLQTLCEKCNVRKADAFHDYRKRDMETLKEAIANSVWLDHRLGDKYSMDHRDQPQKLGGDKWQIAYYPILECGKTGERYSEARALVEKPIEGGIDFREIPLRYLKKITDCGR